MELIHGGDWAGFSEENGYMPLDFSANISPLGLPKAVSQAVVQSLEAADRYPDPLCRELRACLARRHNLGKLGLSEENILCGNGAADLIFRLVAAKKPKEALVTAPAFAEYEQALKLSGSQVRRFLLREENDFAVTGEILEQITPKTDLVFLCEPNNPTGRTTDRALLLAVLRRCEKTGTLLVADECFQEFLDEPEAHTLQGELARCPHLLILKAFTKCYAMAGLRLGYALCGDTGFLDTMRRAGQPWAVSTPAQAAGTAALQEEDYIERLRKLICKERSVMSEALSGLGLRVCPGEANYLLFFCRDSSLGEKLRRRGILIRDCSNYPGLRPGWFRVAVRTGGENQRLIKAIEEVL